VEIEAKFLVADEETLTRLELADELASFQLLPGRPLEVRDVYLDTDDRCLLAAGYALRKRRQNGNCLLTVKGLSALEGAVHRRTESEAQLPEDAPQERWPSEEMRELLDRIAKG
jgi:inorganic triphosphatase YgiF